MGRLVIDFWWFNPLTAFALSEAQLISLVLMVLWLALLIMQSGASKANLEKAK
jgi:hypothetical protein